MRKVIKKGEVVEVKRFNWTSWLFLATIMLIVFVAVFLVFGFVYCENKTCFDKALKDCDRAKFVYGDGMIFEYMIKGKSGDGCEVNVKLLQGNLNDADSAKLEGLDMICVLPLGVVMNPENDIGSCHGMLKEGLQDLIIEKLNTYLVQNLGQLNLEIAGIPSV